MVSGNARRRIERGHQSHQERLADAHSQPNFAQGGKYGWQSRKVLAIDGIPDGTPDCADRRYTGND